LLKRRIVWLNILVPLGIFLAILIVTSPLIFQTDWDIAVKWSAIGSLATVLGLGVAVYIGSIALLQFQQSQRRPDLSLVFADSLVTSTTMKVPEKGISIYNINLAIINKGSTLAIWWEVIVNLSEIPWSKSCTAAGWAQVAAQDEFRQHKFIVRSSGSAAVYTSTPLEIGVVQLFDCFTKNKSKHEIKYQINGDWGAPKTGSLWLNVEIA
jgi:hypothetical protein